jgi:hypothetical protein
VRSGLGAASALASLRKSAHERFMVLVLDAERRPIAVLRLFAGATTVTSVYPEVVTKAVYEIPNAAYIWYAHNHPSGIATASQADVAITCKLSQAFGLGTGITVDGHIVIAGNSFTEMDSEGAQIGNPGTAFRIPPVARTRAVPILERRYTKVGVLGDKIGNPATAKQQIAAIAQGQTGVVFADAQNRPNAFLPMSMAQMVKLRDDGAPSGARILFGAAARSNAASAFLHLVVSLRVV